MPCANCYVLNYELRTLKSWVRKEVGVTNFDFILHKNRKSPKIKKIIRIVKKCKRIQTDPVVLQPPPPPSPPAPKRPQTPPKEDKELQVDLELDPIDFDDDFFSFLSPQSPPNDPPSPISPSKPSNKSSKSSKSSSKPSKASKSSLNPSKTPKREKEAPKSLEEPSNESPNDPELEVPSEDNPYNKKLLCPECGKRIKSARYLRIHQRRMHLGIRKFSCSECSKSFFSQYQLSNHKYEVHSGVEITCKSCGAPYASIAGLRRHEQRVHQIREDHKCPKPGCGRVFPVKSDLRRHLKTGRHSKPGVPEGITPSDGLDLNYVIKCTFRDCYERDFTFDSVGRLAQHVKSSHKGDRIYECVPCGLGFAKEDSLQAHSLKVCKRKKNMDYHWPVPCPICEREIVVKGKAADNLKKHIDNVHRRVRAFPCPIEDCSAGYAKKDDFAAHLLKNHPQAYCPKKYPWIKELKQYSCEICDQIFLAYNSYKSHKLTHISSDSGEFPCTFRGCGKRFKIKRSLENHIKTMHSQERPYQCPKCWRDFALKWPWIKHVERHNEDKVKMPVTIEGSPPPGYSMIDMDS